jgi:hypothetical protein
MGAVVRRGLWVLVAVAALALAAQAFGQEKPPVRPPGEGKEVPAPNVLLSARIAQFLGRPRADETDPLAICSVLFSLSEEQKKGVEQLAAERGKQLEKMWEELNKQYAEKAKAVLTEAQRKAFDRAAEVLAKHRQTADAAEAALRETGGARLADRARMGLVRPGTSLVGYLELTPEQREAIRKLQMEALKELDKAREGAARPPATADKDANREYGEKITRIRDKAQADFDEKQKALLTPEQKEKLAKMDEALKAFLQKVEEAQKALQADLTEALKAE